MSPCTRQAQVSTLIKMVLEIIFPGNNSTLAQTTVSTLFTVELQWEAAIRVTGDRGKPVDLQVQRSLACGRLHRAAFTSKQLSLE